VSVYSPITSKSKRLVIYATHRAPFFSFCQLRYSITHIYTFNVFPLSLVKPDNTVSPSLNLLSHVPTHPDLLPASPVRWLILSGRLVRGTDANGSKIHGQVRLFLLDIILPAHGFTLAVTIFHPAAYKRARRILCIRQPPNTSIDTASLQGDPIQSSSRSTVSRLCAGSNMQDAQRIHRS